MRALGLAVNDASHRRLLRLVRELRLDTAHFTRRTKDRGSVSRRASPVDRTLVLLPETSARTKHERLHRALQAIGVPYQCQTCGNGGTWLGRSITLQIDHINGDWRDNREANLRYLCPNCHALTDSWCKTRAARSSRSL